MHASFIAHLVSHLIETFDFPKSNQFIVLPSKRAKIFILRELAARCSFPFFAPQILTLDELVAQITQLRKLDSTSLLFEFYSIYLQSTPVSKHQTIDVFSSWAYRVLADFSDIDSYLLDSDYVFSYLEAAEALKRWQVDSNDATSVIDNQLDFWASLPHYYTSFKSYLLSSQSAYHGLMYKQASLFAPSYIDIANDYYFFVGFNAITPAEKAIFDTFLKSGKASIYWDIDAHFINHPQHEAAYFINKHRQWSYFKSHEFQWIFNDYILPKNISVVGTPKNIGQAKVCAEIIKKWYDQDATKSTAVILGDESLLIPVLQHLPAVVDAVNVTMSFPSHHNTFITTLHHLIFAQIKSKQKSSSHPVFYFKDLWAIFQDANIRLLWDATDVQKFIAEQNYTYVTYDTLYRISNQSPWVERFFAPWSTDLIDVIELLQFVLTSFRDVLKAKDEEHLIPLSFVYAAHQSLQQTASYVKQFQLQISLEFFLKLWRQMARNSKVAFEGEPLQGLQIMGLLESRVLDFDRVIILSVNEGILPAGKSNDSYIPYDIRRELGLPTFKEKDALFAYYFYHTLQRASEVCLVYNTDAEGAQANEPSRYIWQLEADAVNANRLHKQIMSPKIPFVNQTPIQIPKSDALLHKLKDLAVKGFSPSSLLQYIRDPYTFYLRKVLDLREQEEVEESIAVNTLGTVMHKVLEDLYKPFLQSSLKAVHFSEMKKKLPETLQLAFKDIYKAGAMHQGKNKLSFEVAKATLERYLSEEEVACASQDIVVLALEQTFKRTLIHPELPCEILIKGNFDRIERRDGQLTIVDYKTGKVEQKQLILTDMSALELSTDFEKVFQLLSYAWLYGVESSELPVVGIRSFKNNKAGFMPLQISGNSELNAAHIAHFEYLLVQLLKEIYAPDLPFTQKID